MNRCSWKYKEIEIETVRETTGLRAL